MPVQNLEKSAVALRFRALRQAPVATRAQNDRPGQPHGGHRDGGVAVVAAQPQHLPCDGRIGDPVAKNSRPVSARPARNRSPGTDLARLGASQRVLTRTRQHESCQPDNLAAPGEPERHHEARSSDGQIRAPCGPRYGPVPIPGLPRPDFDADHVESFVPTRSGQSTSRARGASFIATSVLLKPVSRLPQDPSTGQHIQLRLQVYLETGVWMAVRASRRGIAVRHRRSEGK